MSNYSKSTSQSIYTYVRMAAPSLASSSGHWRMYALNTRPIAMHEACMIASMNSNMSLYCTCAMGRQRTYVRSIHSWACAALFIRARYHVTRWSSQIDFISSLFGFCTLIHVDWMKWNIRGWTRNWIKHFFSSIRTYGTGFIIQLFRVWFRARP